jgi:NADH:ubiquinone oxidoreductase subunit C
MTKQELIDHIQGNFTGSAEVIENDHPEPYFKIAPAELQSFARFIHDDPRLQLHFLMNLSGVDTTEAFEVVYNVCSYTKKHRIFFKIVLDRENPEFDTVISIWPGANWFEREVWELYGINVRNHPDLRRFLLTEDWDEGFPMRKGWTGTDFVTLPEV